MVLEKFSNQGRTRKLLLTREFECQIFRIRNFRSNECHGSDRHVWHCQLAHTYTYICYLCYVFDVISDIDKDQYEKLKELATQLQITNLYYKTIDLKNCLEALTFSNDPDSIEIAMDLALENYEIVSVKCYRHFIIDIVFDM